MGGLGTPMTGRGRGDELVPLAINWLGQEGGSHDVHSRFCFICSILYIICGSIDTRHPDSEAPSTTYMYHTRGHVLVNHYAIYLR